MFKCFNNNIWDSPANLLSLFYSILITTQSAGVSSDPLFVVYSRQNFRNKERCHTKTTNVETQKESHRFWWEDCECFSFSFLFYVVTSTRICIHVIPTLCMVLIICARLSSRCSFSFYCLSLLLLSSYFCPSHWRLCSPLARQLCTTRICPLSHLLQDVILKTEAFKLDTTVTSQYWVSYQQLLKQREEIKGRQAIREKHEDKMGERRSLM